MNQTLPARMVALAILACAIPIAVRADLSENTILQTGSALNLDTGAVAGSGGDILWNGSTIAGRALRRCVITALLGLLISTVCLNPIGSLMPGGLAGRRSPPICSSPEMCSWQSRIAGRSRKSWSSRTLAAL